MANFFASLMLMMGLFILSSCLPLDESTQTASCLPPMDMAAGEQVTYQVNFADELYTLRLEQTDSETIRLTRVPSNAPSTTVTLTWQEQAHCPNYTTGQSLSLIEQLLVYNSRPLALVRELFEQPVPGAENPPTQLLETNLVCRAAPPFETCEADYQLDGQMYHWRAVTQVDGPRPGFGLSEFTLQNLSRSLVTIELIEWNGL